MTWRIQTGSRTPGVGTFWGYVYKLGKGNYENSNHPGRKFPTIAAAADNLMIPIGKPNDDARPYSR